MAHSRVIQFVDTIKEIEDRDELYELTEDMVNESGDIPNDYCSEITDANQYDLDIQWLFGSQGLILEKQQDFCWKITMTPEWKKAVSLNHYSRIKEEMDKLTYESYLSSDLYNLTSVICYKFGTWIFHENSWFEKLTDYAKFDQENDSVFYTHVMIDYHY